MTQPSSAAGSAHNASVRIVENHPPESPEPEDAPDGEEKEQ